MAQGEAVSAGLLGSLGALVRARRDALGLSRRALAGSSGLSERFLADVEAGAGNISLQRLAPLARALGTSAAALLALAESQAGEGAPPFARSVALLAGLGPDEQAEAALWLSARFGRPASGPLVALLGLRGAGKSTIGRRLAARLAVPFVELDEQVERAAGLTLGGIFSIHGEAYYRRLAREVLARLLSELEAAVIATGGGLPTDREAWGLLRRRCRTVWLRATPEEHWRRVLAQGDERPGAASENAQAELRALLQAREPLYAQADLSVDTARLGVEGAVEEVARALAPA